MKKKVRKDLNKLSFTELQKAVKSLAKQKDQATTKKVGVWKVGQCYFIRTVTMALLGRLIQVTDRELVLEEASWIADTGRFADFLQGKFKNELEVEPFPDKVIVGRGSIVDACAWQNKLLREQK